MGKKRSKLNFLISFLAGFFIFFIFLYKTGGEAILLLLNKINFFYLFIYLILTSSFFIFAALRWQVILNAYKDVREKKICFFRLLKQTIAGYAVAYITPSVRLGGEPLRAYMLKKEEGINLKTGASSIVIDKFVELAGTALFGVLGLILLLTIPGISLSLKIILLCLILFTFIFLFVIYYRTVLGKGVFSSLFDLFNSGSLDQFINAVKGMEKKMEEFFKNYKKRFFLSFMFYFAYGLTAVIEMKFLFLSFGVNASIFEIALSLIILGLVNFIPVPAALGFLEAGQSSLFEILQGQGSVGFALSLLLRARSLIFVGLGFGLISYFSGKEVRKKVKEIRSQRGR